MSSTPSAPSAARGRRIGAAVEHPRQPIQRRIGIDPRTDSWSVRSGRSRLAALVEPATGAPPVSTRGTQHRPPLDADLWAATRATSTQIHEAPGVAIGVGDQRPACVGREVQPPDMTADRTLEQAARSSSGHRVAAGPRLRRAKQGASTSNDGSFGRRTDERDKAGFDVRQKRVLLGLVEPVHLIDEEDGAPSGLRQRRFRARDGVADILDPARTADSAMNSALKARAIKRASVVLPTPGGPRAASSEACRPRT